MRVHRSVLRPFNQPATLAAGAAFALALGAPACTPGVVGDGATAGGGAASTRESALFAQAPAQLWNDNVIGVSPTVNACFTVRPRLEDPGSHVTCPGQTDRNKDCFGSPLSTPSEGIITDSLRASIQQTVSSTWGHYGNITVNWLGDCPIDPSINMHRNSSLTHTIAIQFQHGDAVPSGTCSATSPCTAPGTTCSIPSGSTSGVCIAPCSTDDQCATTYANTVCGTPSGQSNRGCIPSPSGVDWTGFAGKANGFPTVIQYNWPVIRTVDVGNVIHEFGHVFDGRARKHGRVDTDNSERYGEIPADAKLRAEMTGQQHTGTGAYDAHEEFADLFLNFVTGGFKDDKLKRWFDGHLYGNTADGSVPQDDWGWVDIARDRDDSKWITYSDQFYYTGNVYLEDVAAYYGISTDDIIAANRDKLVSFIDKSGTRRWRLPTDTWITIPGLDRRHRPTAS